MKEILEMKRTHDRLVKRKKDRLQMLEKERTNKTKSDTIMMISKE